MDRFRQGTDCVSVQKGDAVNCNRCGCEINKDQQMVHGLNNVTIHSYSFNCINGMKSKIKLLESKNKALRIDYQDIKYLYESYITAKQKEKDFFG